MVQVCVAAGELARAGRMFGSRRRGRRASSASTRWIRAARCSARREARYEKAARLYREAEAAWGEFGSVFGRAYALHGLGRCGDEKAAREAAAIFEGLGAAPFSAVARAA